MGWNVVRVGLLVLALGGGVFGCHKSALQSKDPGDPLLKSTPPVEGRTRTARSSPLMRPEAPPPPPGSAVTDKTLSVQRDPLTPIPQ